MVTFRPAMMVTPLRPVRLHVESRNRTPFDQALPLVPMYTQSPQKRRILTWWMRMSLPPRMSTPIWLSAPAS